MRIISNAEELFGKIERIIIRLLLLALLFIVAIKVIAKELESFM